MVEGKVTEVTSPRAWAEKLWFGFYSERGVTACAKILVLILFLKGRGFNRLRRNPGFGWRSAFSAAIRPYFNEGFSLWGTRTIVFPQAARAGTNVGKSIRSFVRPPLIYLSLAFSLTFCVSVWFSGRACTFLK